MCTVQVLLFAEVMRRSTPNYQGGAARRPGNVCRKLFANDPAVAESRDPATVAREMEAQLLKEVRQRWNFDFAREEPLPGRYQWIPVGAGATSPTVSEARSSASPSSEVCLVAEVRRKSTVRPIPASKNNAGVATQSKITSFMTKRKRPVPVEAKASSFHPLKSRRLSNDSRVHTTISLT